MSDHQNNMYWNPEPRWLAPQTPPFPPQHLTLSRKTRVGDVEVENAVTIEMVVGESSLAAGLRAWDILDLAEKK